MSKRRVNWVVIGLAATASIAGGLLIGEDASASIDPFYANAAMRGSSDRANREVEIIRDGDAVRTPDYGQAQAIQQASDDRVD